MAGFTDRLLASAMYLMFPALLPEALFRSRSPLVRRHRANALASAALLAALVILFALGVVAISYAMVHYRDLFRSWRIETNILDILWKTLLAWMVLHAFALVHAAVWPRRHIPVLDGLGTRRIFRAAGRGFIGIVTMLAVVAGTLAVDAIRLTTPDPGNARVFFVYEDNDRFPRWLFQLGAYRIARESSRVYGHHSTDVIPLSLDNIRRALREGEFVIIGSHGMEQGLIADGRFVTPRDIYRKHVNRKLEYVYLTGCDSAALAKAWRHKLRPAEVVTHDRLTAVIEHIWWLWIDGPKKLREVLAEQNDHGEKNLPVAP